jgi:hypothetical protein
VEFEGNVTTSIGSNEAAIGGHATVAPIARNLVRQGGVEFEASPYQRIERSTSAPVERQKSACLAGCGSGHLRPFDDDDLNPAATEEIGGACADYAAAANHNAHVLPLRNKASVSLLSLISITFSIRTARSIGDFALLASAKYAILQRLAFGYSTAASTEITEVSAVPASVWVLGAAAIGPA